MGGYVANLHEYINNLAGKKARADRGWEEMLGRQMYNVAKNVEGRVAANMIALNPGSWITNFIPLTQAAGEVSTPNLAACGLRHGKECDSGRWFYGWFGIFDQP